MNPTADDGSVWDWIVPALVVFGVTAVLVVGAVWAIRAVRNAPRARAAAEAERAQAGQALVHLDDAVEALDVEVALSGALYADAAPPTLRRARMRAQHARDRAFERFGAIDASGRATQTRRAAVEVRTAAEKALAEIGLAREEHGKWVATHVPTGGQVAATRERFDALRIETGDQTALLDELRERFDEREWADAARSADRTEADLAAAERFLVEAEQLAAEPGRAALRPLQQAERRLRSAEAAARALEESHRLVTEAAHAVPGELRAARLALSQAPAARGDLEPDDAARLDARLAELDDALAAAEAQAARRPTDTVAAVARIRLRLDLALGDARTAQQRLRGARTALPGTLAAARGVLAHASATAEGAGADARSRLLAAQQELAAARQSTDPVSALDAARRAMRHAEDAIALADGERLARGG